MTNALGSWTHDPALLQRSDALARSFLARDKPRVDVATDIATRDAVFRLRGDTAIEHGWLSQNQLRDGRERDELDEDAVQLAAWIDGALAGTARLILPVPN